MDKALMLLAKQLNKLNILWAVGGSLVLKNHQIVGVVNDIDILVHESGINKVVDFLDEVAIREVPSIKSDYSTKYFYEYTYESVSVDVMSRFTIKHTCGEFEFPFDELSVTQEIDMDGVKVPLTSVEEWYVAYMLMHGRSEKVELIENYWMTHSLDHPELLRRMMKQPLPEAITKKIQVVLNDN